MLAVIWVTVIITGFLVLGAIVWDVEALIAFGRIHSFVARLGIVYTAIYIYRHKKQVLSCFGIKISNGKQIKKMGIEGQSPKSKCIIKITTVIALHIVLHAISIHLAVACTIFHIVQHRHEVLALVKKLLFNHNNNHNRSLQLTQITV